VFRSLLPASSEAQAAARPDRLPGYDASDGGDERLEVPVLEDVARGALGDGLIDLGRIVVDPPTPSV
jgi:hypothetical protein